MYLGVNIHIDDSALETFDKLDKVIEAECKELGRQLSAMVYSKVVDYAGQRLNSRYAMYLQGLKQPVEVDGVFVVELDAKLMWIEDGMEPHDMLDKLLASPKAKTSKDGSKYVVVPFKHDVEKVSTGESIVTNAHNDLISTIRKTMEQKNIPWSDIETNKSGKPKLGRIHTFNIMNSPLKTHQGPEQGHGAIGQPRQGNTGIPFLQGVNVYQKQRKGKVTKDIVTFRIASESQRGQKWMHPGLAGVHILNDVYQWAEQEIRDKIAPQVSERIMKALGL